MLGRVRNTRWLPALRSVLFAVLFMYALLVAIAINNEIGSGKFSKLNCPTYMYRPVFKPIPWVEREYNRTRASQSPSQKILFPLFEWMDALSEDEQDLFQTSIWRPLYCDSTSHHPFQLCLVRTYGFWHSPFVMHADKSFSASSNSILRPIVQRDNLYGCACALPRDGHEMENWKWVPTNKFNGSRSSKVIPTLGGTGYIKYSTRWTVRTREDILAVLSVSIKKLFGNAAGNKNRSYLSVLLFGDSLARGVFTQIITLLRGEEDHGSSGGVYDRGTHGRSFYVATTRGDVLLYRSAEEEAVEADHFADSKRPFFQYSTRQRIIDEARARLGGDIIFVMEYAFSCYKSFSDFAEGFLRVMNNRNAMTVDRSKRFHDGEVGEIPTMRDEYDIFILPLSYPQRPRLLTSFNEDLATFASFVKHLSASLDSSQQIFLLNGPTENQLYGNSVCSLLSHYKESVIFRVNRMWNFLVRGSKPSPRTAPELTYPHETDKRLVLRNQVFRKLAGEQALSHAWSAKEKCHIFFRDGGKMDEERGAPVSLIDLEVLGRVAKLTRHDHIHSFTNLYPHFPIFSVAFKGQGEGHVDDPVTISAVQLIFTVIGERFLGGSTSM